MDVYFQQVTTKDVFSLRFGEDATVKDAKEELSRSRNFSLDGMKLLFKSKILQDTARLSEMQTSEKTPINFFVKKTNSAQASPKPSSQIPSQPSTETTTTQPAQSESSQPPAEPTNPTPPEPSKPSIQPEQQTPVTQPVQPESPKPPSSPSLNPQPAQPFGQPTQPFGQPSPQPFGQPSQPFGQPSQPFGQPSPQPFGQPSQPFGQPSQPFGQPAQPFGQPSQPFGQPSQPFTQPTQPAQPFAQPTQPSSNESHVPLQQSRPVYDVDHPLIINEEDPTNPYKTLTKEEALEMLTEMGFDKDQCLEALRLTKGIVNYAQLLLVEGDVSEQGLAKVFPQQSSVDKETLVKILMYISENPQLIQAVRNGQPVSIGGQQVTIPPQLLNEFLVAKNQVYSGMSAGGYGGMGAGAYGGMNPGMGAGSFGGATPGMGAGAGAGGFGGMSPGMGAGAYGTTPGMGAGAYGTTPGMGAGGYGGMNPGMGAGGYGGMNPGMGAGAYGGTNPQQQQQLQQYQREIAALLSKFTQPEQEEIKTLIREGYEPLNAIQMYDAADKDINAARELLKSCLD